MQLPSEQDAERKRIKRNPVIPIVDLQIGGRKKTIPLSSALVVVRQDDAMRTVAHPVHKFQGLEIQPAFGQVIFDQNVAAAYRAASQSSLSIACVWCRTSTNMDTSKDEVGYGIVTPSNGAHSIKQVGRGAISIPRTSRVGLSAFIDVAMVPSPQPISSTEDPGGSLAANNLASTRTRLLNTAFPCAFFKSERAKELCESASITVIYGPEANRSNQTGSCHPHGLECGIGHLSSSIRVCDSSQDGKRRKGSDASGVHRRPIPRTLRKKLESIT